MKIHGKKLPGPAIETVVLPRGDGEPIVFKARAVTDYSAFLLLCPPPPMPKSQRPGGEWFENPEDPDYKKKLLAHGRFQWEWMHIESLKATDGLEWETVKADDPETWKNWRTEMEREGFATMEIAMVGKAVRCANVLDEKHIEEARKRFFSQVAQAAVT